MTTCWQDANLKSCQPRTGDDGSARHPQGEQFRVSGTTPRRAWSAPGRCWATVRSMRQPQGDQYGTTLASARAWGTAPASEAGPSLHWFWRPSTRGWSVPASLD